MESHKHPFLAVQAKDTTHRPKSPQNATQAKTGQ